MTDDQINIVRKTWRLLREVDPHLLGDVFYKRLFFKSPLVRLLSRRPMTTQYEKFVAMLNFIVARIDHPDARNEIADMVKRYEGYGFKPTHYIPVGEALLWTLGQGLGDEWNDEVQQAWQACYDALTQAIRANA